MKKTSTRVLQTENYLREYIYVLAWFCDSVVARDGRKQENLLLTNISHSN
jgi:hypothetical protein